MVSVCVCQCCLPCYGIKLVRKQQVEPQIGESKKTIVKQTEGMREDWSVDWWRDADREQRNRWTCSGPFFQQFPSVNQILDQVSVVHSSVKLVFIWQPEQPQSCADETCIQHVAGSRPRRKIRIIWLVLFGVKFWWAIAGLFVPYVLKLLPKAHLENQLLIFTEQSWMDTNVHSHFVLLNYSKFS